MIIGIACKQKAELIFLNEFLFLKSDGKFDLYIDAALKNLDTFSIYSFQVHFTRLSDFSVRSYPADMILDPNLEWNKNLYHRFEWSGNELIIGVYPKLNVKEIVAEKVLSSPLRSPATPAEPVNVAVPTGISPGESVFFRLWCSAIQPSLGRGPVRNLRFQNYPDA